MSLESSYYAFISYSRKDSRAAAFLQRQLEHFRIPVKLIHEEQRADSRKFCRPVFRDKRDLPNTEHSFTEEIKKALCSSRYLLVLCSPNSAGSRWVADEIDYFLKNHGDDYARIVPVILTGRPGSGTEEECLPENLNREVITSRNLPSMIPDDGCSEKEGWENGLVQTLSFMLKVDREKIKATVDKERQRQKHIYEAIAAAFCLVIAIFYASAVWLGQRKADAENRTHIQQALSILAEDEVGQRDTGAALVHLAKAAPLLEARMMLAEMLCQCSWLVPIDREAGKQGIPAPQPDPEDFPLQIIHNQEKASLAAKDKASGKTLWSMSSQFGLMRKAVSPNGLALVLEYAMPNHHLEVRDPWDGRLLWSRKTSFMLKDWRISPDGRRIAILYPNGIVQVIQTTTGKADFESLRVHSSVTHLAFSPDSLYLKACSPAADTRYILLRQTPHVMVSENGGLTGESIYDDNHDCLWIAYHSAGGNTHLQAYHADSWSKGPAADIAGSVTGMSLAQDGRRLYAGVEANRKGELLVFNVSKPDSLELLHRLPLPFIPGKLASDKNGCHLIGNGLEKSPSAIWKWDEAEPNQCKPTCFTDDSAIKDFELSDDGRMLLLGTSIRTFDMATGKQLSSMKAQISAQKCWLCNDDIIVSNQLPRRIEAYDIAGKLKWASMPYAQPGTIPLAIDDSNQIVAVATGPSQLRMYDIHSGKALSDAIALPGPVESLAFLSWNGEQAVAIGMKCGSKGGYAVWNMASKSLSQVQLTLDTGAGVLCAIPKNRFYLGNNPNKHGYIVTLPDLGRLDETAIAEIQRYTALTLNEHHAVAPAASDSTMPLPCIPYWQDAVQQRENAKNAAASPTAFSNMLSVLSQDNQTAQELALDLYPPCLPAMCDYWLGFAMQRTQENYFRKHPDVTEEAFRQERLHWGARQWGNYVVSDPQSRYFADFFTQYMLELYPDNTDAQAERDAFLKLIGAKRGTAQDGTTPQNKTQNDISFDMLSYAMSERLSHVTTREGINQFFAEIQSMLQKSNSWDDKSPVSKLTLATIACRCTMYGIYDGGTTLPQITDIIKMLSEKAETITPTAEKNTFLSQLAPVFAEYHILKGDETNAHKCLKMQKDLAEYNPLADLTDKILQTLAEIRFGNQAKALAEWKEYHHQLQLQQPDMANMQTWRLWADVDILAAMGFNLNDGWKDFSNGAAKRFLKGTQIQCLPEGQAERIGWKNNDCILRIAGFPIIDPDALILLVTAQKVAANKDCPVVLLRNGVIVESTISFAEPLGISF